MGPPAGEFGYSCSESSLVLNIPAGLAPFSTSTYQRVSEIPATPEPAEDFAVAPPGGESPPGDLGDGGGLCSQVTASAFSASGSTATWSLANSGGALDLNALSISWPAANDNLVEIALNGTPVWTGDETSPFFVFDDWSGDRAARTLSAGGGSLSLSFDGPAASAGYGLTMQFSGGCNLLDIR
jgi:hypothetical protein